MHTLSALGETDQSENQFKTEHSSLSAINSSFSVTAKCSRVDQTC